jgi:hypothetical protein
LRVYAHDLADVFERLPDEQAGVAVGVGAGPQELPVTRNDQGLVAYRHLCGAARDAGTLDRLERHLRHRRITGGTSIDWVVRINRADHRVRRGCA